MLSCALFTVYVVASVLFFIPTSVHGINGYVRSRSDPSRIIRYDHPYSTQEGGSVRLVCEYDREDDPVTSVKWYKRNQEFFRYDSDSEPQFTTFPMRGIEVDVSRSNISSVYLKMLNIHSCGYYKCRVSSQYYFKDEGITLPIRVEVPPWRGPYIDGKTSDYHQGDYVKLTCKSQEAKPAPELWWYINDEHISFECRKLLPCVTPRSPDNFRFHYIEACPDLEKSYQELRFRITPHIIYNGQIRLSCKDKYINRATEITIHIEELRDPLRIEELSFPSPVLVGRSIRLHCNYDLGEEKLLAIKWYKDDTTFFEYFPDSKTQFRYNNFPGVDVVMKRSNENSVYLRNITLESSGNYTCQGFSTAPYFTHSRITKKLDVIEHPYDGPLIIEDQFEHTIGGNVSFTCLSGEAKPAPNLKWFINKEMAPSNFTNHTITEDPYSQLEVSELSLNFVLEPELLHNGRVLLTCVSNLRGMSPAIDIKVIRPMA